MNGPSVPAIKARLNLSSNHANTLERPIKTYAEVVINLLSCYDTDSVIAKAEAEIRNFKQGSLTPRNYSEKS